MGSLSRFRQLPRHRLNLLRYARDEAFRGEGEGVRAEGEDPAGDGGETGDGHGEDAGAVRLVHFELLRGMPDALADAARGGFVEADGDGDRLVRDIGVTQPELVEDGLLLRRREGGVERRQGADAVDGEVAILPPRVAVGIDVP